MLEIIKITTTDIHSGEPHNVVFSAGAKCVSELKYNPSASEQGKEKKNLTQEWSLQLLVHHICEQCTSVDQP